MSARILVVDDVDINIRLLEAKLTAEYYDVLSASDGEEALRRITEDKPDIVLLDVMMPGMDGFEVCRAIRELPGHRHLPVVMVTALSDQADRVRGLEAGADDFLTKPVNDVALMARVKSLLRIKMLLDELQVREETSLQLGGSALDFDSHTQLADRQFLVVEDNPHDAEVAISVLGEVSNVVAVADADEALRLAAGGEFDAIVVSLELESSDPLRLCSSLRSQKESRHCAILATLEEGGTARLAKALELGVNDYLMKPIDPSEFRARIRTQLRYKLYQDYLRGAFQRTATMAITDSLTGLYNRRYGVSHLKNLRDSREGGTEVAAIMVDIDHFKLVNDSHGHSVGDEVLCEVAQRLQNVLRGQDLVARLGGEEFLVIISNTDLALAKRVAERLCVCISATPFVVSAGQLSLNVTVSVGVAHGFERQEDPEIMVQRADEAMYAAKRAGRNRVCVAGEADASARTDVDESDAGEPKMQTEVENEG